MPIAIVTEPKQDSALFHSLVRVMDHLEGSGHETVKPADRREMLTRAALLACHDQQLPHSLEAIHHAVDQQLTVAPEENAAAPFSFGWRRPNSLTALKRKRKNLASRWRHYLRSCYAYAGAREGEGEGRQALNALIWGVSGWAITALAVKLFTHLSALHSIAATLPLAFIFFFVVGLNGRKFFKMLGGAATGNPWDEIAPTDYHIAQWKSIPPATAYAQQCFLSGVPFMLQRDIEALKQLMAEHQQQVQQQATEKRRCAVAQQFFTS